MAHVSITNLSEFSERINRDIDLDEVEVKLTLQAVKWLYADIHKRRQRLTQSVTDPHTKASRRSKREKELYLLSQVDDVLHNIINPDNEESI